MDECRRTGCRNFQTTCIACGRITSTACLPKTMEWISVEDKIPPENEDVLIFFPNEGITVGYYWEEDWHDWRGWSNKYEYVSHWMSLPEEPKDK